MRIAAAMVATVGLAVFGAEGLLAQAGLRPVGEFGGFVGHRYAIAAIRA